MMNKRNRLVHDRLQKPYSRVLIPAEDGTYCAEILEFPGCYAEGKTPEEAIRNLESAADSWIEAALEQGQDIPEPLASYGYSGKINLRLPRSIHKKAARFAQKDNVSLNQFFASAIAARVGSRIGAEEFYDHLIKKLEARLIQPALVINLNTGFRFISRNVRFLPETYRSMQDLSLELPINDAQIAWNDSSSTASIIELEKVSTDG